MEALEDRTKRDCFGYKMGECTVLTELVCKESECAFYKTKKQFREDAERARKIREERKMNNVK